MAPHQANVHAGWREIGVQETLLVCWRMLRTDLRVRWAGYNHLRPTDGQ